MHCIQATYFFVFKSVKNSFTLGDFVDYLRENDFAANTVRGYKFDLEKFIEWFVENFGYPFEPDKLAALDLINYRQFLLNVRGLQPTTVNRRLEALRKLCRWLVQTKKIKIDVAASLKPLKFVRNRQPAGLSESEVHALLRVAGSSNFAVRNYAIVQLMVQTGLRVSEVAALKISDVKASERSGTVLVRQSKGLKDREIPLNASVRRAVRSYSDSRRESNSEAFFLNQTNEALSKRMIQSIITQFGKKAKITRVSVSAHTLRHTFALNYLKQNPGKIVDLANLLGHESLDTTAIYTKPSLSDLSRDLEKISSNVYG